MDNQRLREALRPIARAARTPAERKLDATVSAAFDDAGGVKPEALQRSLPPLMLTWWLPGAVTAGSNAGMEVTLSGPIQLRDFSLRAKNPPVGGECTVRLTANGTAVETVSIQAAQTSGRSVVSGSHAFRAAGEVLRLDVVTASGAANVTVVVTYTVAE